MRQFLTILLVAGLIWAGVYFKKFVDQKVKEGRPASEAVLETAPGKVRGMAPQLEASLEEAKRGGPDGLRDWLRVHRAEVEDPRLADIDMDYIVLVGRTNPDEARRVLTALSRRMTPQSPVYKRFQQLEKVYK